MLTTGSPKDVVAFYYCYTCSGAVQPTEDSNSESLFVCPNCNHITYPIIDPTDWRTTIRLPDRWPAYDQDIGDILRELVGFIEDSPPQGIVYDFKRGVRVLGVQTHKDLPFLPITKIAWSHIYSGQIIVQWQPYTSS